MIGVRVRSTLALNGLPQKTLGIAREGWDYSQGGHSIYVQTNVSKHTF